MILFEDIHNENNWSVDNEETGLHSHDSHENGVDHELLAGVKKIIASKADMEERQIEASSKLKDLAVDSLVNAEIILALEEEYGLDSISEKEAESLITVADAAALVAAKKREKEPAGASTAR